MIENQAIQDKRRRVSKVRGLLKKATEEGKEVPVKRFIASLCMDMGLSRRKANEYVDDLKELGDIEINEQGEVETITYIGG